MVRPGWIFLMVGLGVSLLAGVLITLVILCCMAKRNKKKDAEFTGIAGNAALVNALQQSFAYQSQAVQALTNTYTDADEECLTCSLIQMGSSMAYSDNSCPQCGRKCV